MSEIRTKVRQKKTVEQNLMRTTEVMVIQNLIQTEEMMSMATTHILGADVLQFRKLVLR